MIIISLSWKLCLSMIAVLPVASVFMVCIGNKLKDVEMERADMIFECETVLQESLKGICTVKDFSSEHIQTKR